MVAESIQIPTNEASNRERTAKMVLYFGIFSIVMLFAGLISAYIVSSFSEVWVDIRLPEAFYVSTLLILLSSLTIKLAVNASKKDDRPRVSLFLLITLALGTAFGISQFYGWKELTEEGSYFSGAVDNLEGTYGEDYTILFQGKELIYEDGDYYFPNDELRENPLRNKIAIAGNSASSYIYVLSFVHLLHILGGLLFLLGIYLVGKLSKNKTINPLRLKLGAVYWHFVDGLWLFLFLFLLIFH